MGLKKYILGSILLIIAVFGYTFSIEAGDYRIQIVDFSMLLPVAVWVVLPMVVLFILSLLHMIYYGMKNYFALKAIKKDSSSMAKLISNRLLGTNSHLTFQNQNFKELSNILSQLDISVTNSDFSTSNEQIKKVVDQIFAIKSGKYISSKEIKLPNDNPLMIENLKNRIAQDDNFAVEVISNSDKFPQDIIKEAFNKVIEKKSLTTIKKNLSNIKLDEDMVMKLLEKDSQQEPTLAMSNDEILNIIKKVKLSNQQLIDLAKKYKLTMSPDQILKLYEDIAHYDEEYTTAYLFVLAEYEMIDKMRDILTNSNPDEYIPFKALVDLKDAGKNIYSLERLSKLH